MHCIWRRRVLLQPCTARCYSSPPSRRKPRNPLGPKAEELQSRVAREQKSKKHGTRETNDLPLTSVQLLCLPPFTTLSDLGRIALRSGAHPCEVLGIHVGFEPSQTIPRQQRMLTGVIHFRNQDCVAAFSRTPLLLSVVSSGARRVHAFPPEGSNYPPEQLQKIAEDATPWSPTHARLLQAADAQAQTTLNTENHVQTVNDAPDELNAQWLQRDLPQSSEPLDIESTGAGDAPLVISVPLELSSYPHYAQAVVDRQVELGRTRWITFRVAGSGLARVPLSLLSSWTAPDDEAVVTPPSIPEPGEEESPTVHRYANALNQALAREHQLEAELLRLRKNARDGVLRNAQLTAEAQIRADCGAFGALDGVWLRGALVQRTDGVNYELQALIAFADMHTATRALKLLPIQRPNLYPSSQLRFAQQPWPEALGLGLASNEIDSANATLPPLETHVQEAARAGWARGLARHLRGEVMASKRDKERERVRDEAQGTWAKESLAEVRERLRRT